MAIFPRSPQVSRRPARRQALPSRTFLPRVEPVEERVLLSSLTLQSPTSKGTLPEQVTPIGGLVLDLVGQNGRRVVSQVPASDLFRGFFNSGAPVEFLGNPGTIGVQSGFTPEILDTLGGGLAELAVRLTVFDSDTGPGEFDRDQNFLWLNGQKLGNFSAIATWETSPDGLEIVSENPEGGFRNDIADTGFFFSDDPAFLAELYKSIRADSEVAFQLFDETPFDNYFDFTVGAGDVNTNSGFGPLVLNVAPQIQSVTFEQPVLEGALARLIVKATDPDDPTLLFEFDFNGDGVFTSFEQEPTGEAVHTFPLRGNYPVTVRVTDSFGATDEATLVLNVKNVAPDLTPPMAQIIDEGTESFFDLGSFIDPGDETAWVVTVDWGDNSPVLTFEVDQPGDLGQWNQTYAQDGIYDVRITVQDGEGSGTATFPVEVRNVPPQFLNVSIPELVEPGSPWNLSSEFFDPGILDTFLVSVSWGDGTEARLELPAGTRQLELQHSFEKAGSYPVLLSIVDESGLGDTFTTEITVPEPPEIPIPPPSPEPTPNPPSSEPELEPEPVPEPEFVPEPEPESVVETAPEPLAEPGLEPSPIPVAEATPVLLIPPLPLPLPGQTVESPALPVVESVETETSPAGPEIGTLVDIARPSPTSGGTSPPAPSEDDAEEADDEDTPSEASDMVVEIAPEEEGDVLALASEPTLNTETTTESEEMTSPPVPTSMQVASPGPAATNTTDAEEASGDGDASPSSPVVQTTLLFVALLSLQQTRTRPRRRIISTSSTIR